MFVKSLVTREKLAHSRLAILRQTYPKSAKKASRSTAPSATNHTKSPKLYWEQDSSAANPRKTIITSLANPYSVSLRLNKTIALDLANVMPMLIYPRQKQARSENTHPLDSHVKPVTCKAGRRARDVHLSARRLFTSFACTSSTVSALRQFSSFA